MSEHVPRRPPTLPVIETVDSNAILEASGYGLYPVLIRGGCRQWPIFRSLTFDYLQREKGGVEVTVARRKSAKTVTTTVAAYLSYMTRVRARDPLYLTDWRLSVACPELAESYEVPACFDNWLNLLPDGVRPDWCWLYLGPKNSGTPLHIDVWTSAAWNALLDGMKEWDFVAPKAGKNVTYRCVQEAGDLVFNPSAWAHTVRNASRTLSVTANFVNELNVDIVLAFLRRKKQQAWCDIVEQLKQKHYLNPLARGMSAAYISPR